MENLKNLIRKALIEAGYEITDFSLSLPPENIDADFATNAAIIAGKNFALDPRVVAEKIIANLKSEIIDEISVAAPGFINIKLKAKFYQLKLIEILKAGTDFGKPKIGSGKKALVEFISANPTGPLHIGNARGGPIGEVLSNVLAWQGFEVEREFYVNDTGAQIEKFGQTLAYYYIVKNDSAYRFPENGYPGEFLKEISEEIQKEKASELKELPDEEMTEFFIREGLAKTIRRIKNDTEILGIHFDKFVYESDILNSGESLKVVEKLKSHGQTADREGALWFTANNLDPNDRETVLLRSDADKTPTYFANDIAYHKDKFDRGNDLIIDIWGPGHHAHIARIKSALKALGYDEKKFEVVLYQNVKLKKDGKTLQMGKRLGNFVNISDLIEKMAVPADVFKFMVISQSPASIIDFDLNLALEQSEKNPVYYLQYAHARISSVLKKAPANLVSALSKIAMGEGSIELVDLENLSDKKELDLIKNLLGFEETLKKVSAEFQIQALPHFAGEIARSYHNFYASCQILSTDKNLTRSRLLLILAVRNVLKISLTLMGISAPESM